MSWQEPPRESCCRCAVTVLRWEACSCGPSHGLINKGQERESARPHSLATLTGLHERCLGRLLSGPGEAAVLSELRQPLPLRLQGCRDKGDLRAPPAGGTCGVSLSPSVGSEQLALLSGSHWSRRGRNQ